MSGLLVVGLGNRLRGDDAIGLEVARELRLASDPGLAAIEHEREPIDLLGLWEGAEEVVVVDAVAGGEPGTIHRFGASARSLRGLGPAPASSHALDLAAVIELARALGRLPRRLELIAIECACFALGHPPAEPVRAAGRRVVAELIGRAA